MEPEAKEDAHQQETAESQPEALTSNQVRESYGGNGGEQKKDRPQSGPRWWENVGSWLQIIFNGLVMLFTGGLFYLTYGQLEVAREATEATKKAADAAIIAAQVAQGQLEEMKGSSADTKAVADAAKAQAANTEKLAAATQEQIAIARGLAEATKSSALTAEQTLVLTHRPWIKVTHRITHPLTFTHDKQAWLMFSEVLENIGQSVAIDIVSWAGLFPTDTRMGWDNAIAQRKRHCDRFRHYTPPFTSGVLFPRQHSPSENKLAVTQEGAVQKGLFSLIPEGDKGVVLVLVGCVSYRASFESSDKPRHQTRFIYKLGRSNGERNVAHVNPSGKIPDLTLFPIPEATTAD